MSQTSDLKSQLQSALGAAYVLDRELGGGGMSRVFLATEAALGRAVVIKVIAPELVEGLSAKRFTREVKLAARLPTLGSAVCRVEALRARDDLHLIADSTSCRRLPSLAVASQRQPRNRLRELE